MWGKIIDVLGDRFCCYCVDIVGEPGKSVSSRRFASFAEHAEWLSEVLDQLSLEVVNVAGLSIGGAVAAHFALHAPERLNRLILLCPAATLAPFNPRFMLQAIPALLFKTPSVIRRSLRSSFYSKENTTDPVTELVVMGFRSFIQKAILPPVLSDAELRRLHMPVTLLIGDHEVIYRGGPAAALTRAMQLIPDIRAHIIPQASHILLADNSDAVVARMLEGLE